MPVLAYPAASVAWHRTQLLGSAYACTTVGFDFLLCIQYRAATAATMIANRQAATAKRLFMRIRKPVWHRARSGLRPNRNSCYRKSFVTSREEKGLRYRRLKRLFDASISF